MAVQTWIEEFLFRGRPPEGPGADQPSTFHVIVAQRETSEISPSGYTDPVLRTVTPEVALSKYNLDLTTLVTGINSVAIDRVAELEGQVAALEAQVIALEGQLAAVQAQESE